LPPSPPAAAAGVAGGGVNISVTGTGLVRVAQPPGVRARIVTLLPGSDPLTINHTE
jgi:hypothetical protein